jgi:hypothetical protein
VGGDGRGAKSYDYDRKKAGTSINHSIHSAEFRIHIISGPIQTSRDSSAICFLPG